MNSKTEIAQPRDAAAVILLNQNLTEVVWARRNPQLAFLGGWHAFPGGKVEATDAEIKIKNSENASLEKFIVAAARECFEETGVLLARGGERLTKGQRASLHDDLTSGRFSFAEILENWNLHIDAQDFSYAGFWTTPQFSPVRFKTRFFVAVCPPKQTPRAAISELENVEFIEPQNALALWEKSRVLISPPVLIALKDLPENSKFKIQNSKSAGGESSASSLRKKSRACGGEINYIELNPRVICFPLKTETLPPATHTNCFIVGRKDFAVIDAAAREQSEQAKLFALVDALVENGGVCRRIVVSHAHRDHTGGEIALRDHLLEKFGMRVPFFAHHSTLEKLYGAKFKDFGANLDADSAFLLSDERGEKFNLQVLHTPGHARGHLCFYDEEFGFLLSSDNVVASSSVLIAAPEGDMIAYLNSLERLKNLPNLRFLCGSHGAAVADARGKIESCIAHRMERERKILEAIGNGAEGLREIVEKVYRDVSPDLWTLAEKSVEAHLKKLKIERKISISF